MKQYYILTLDEHFPSVLNWIHDNHIKFEVHLNRTRFWIDPDSLQYTEFSLRFSHCCPYVDPDSDLATGWKY